MVEPFDVFFERHKRLPVFVVLGVQGSGTNLLRSILVQAFGLAMIMDKSLVFNAAAALPEAPSAAAVRRQFALIQRYLQPSPIRRKTGHVDQGKRLLRGDRAPFQSVANPIGSGSGPLRLRVRRVCQGHGLDGGEIG